MNKKTFFKVALLILITCGCSSGLQTDRTHSLSEIKRYARNGQKIRSQGVITEKTGMREFIVTDDDATMKIDLSAYKKESKFLKKNSKIVFSGTFRNRLFTQPFIEVDYLRTVEEFR